MEWWGKPGWSWLRKRGWKERIDGTKESAVKRLERKWEQKIFFLRWEK